MKEGQVENTAEPEEASGNSLTERAEKVDSRIRVTDTIAKAPELLENGASAVLVEGKGPTVDCAPLTSHLNTVMPAQRDTARDDTTHSDTLIMGAQVSERSDRVTEDAMLEQIRSQILQYPPRSPSSSRKDPDRGARATSSVLNKKTSLTEAFCSARR